MSEFSEMIMPERRVGCVQRWHEFIYNSSMLIGLHIKMFLQMLHPRQTTELPLCRSSAKDHLVLLWLQAVWPTLDLL